MLIGLLIFLLVVIALLAVPLDLQFRVEWPDDAHNEVLIRWAFGLVHARVPNERFADAATAHDELPNRRKRSGGQSSNLPAAILQRAFRRRIYRFVADLWRSINTQDLHLRVRIGLGDPAATGQLWAVFGPVSGILAQAEGIEFAVEPDFVDARFEVEGSGGLQLVPLQVIAVTIGLIFSPAIWRGLRTMRRS